MSTITVSRDGISRLLPIGFSWTTLFFGWIPSVVRGHWPMAWSIAVIDVTSLWLSLFVFAANDFMLSFAISRALISSWRNESLLWYMIEDGWRVKAKCAGPKLMNINAANEEW